MSKNKLVQVGLIVLAVYLTYLFLFPILHIVFYLALIAGASLLGRMLFQKLGSSQTSSVKEESAMSPTERYAHSMQEMASNVKS